MILHKIYHYHQIHHHKHNYVFYIPKKNKILQCIIFQHLNLRLKLPTHNQKDFLIQEYFHIYEPIPLSIYFFLHNII